MATACSVVTCLSVFATPDWRPFRAGMFVALGLSAVLPIGHAMQLHSLHKLDELMGLRWVVLEGVLYISGAAIYAVRSFVRVLDVQANPPMLETHPGALSSWTIRHLRQLAPDFSHPGRAGCYLSSQRLARCSQ